VFVHVSTGPFVTANRVDVDVYINGVGPEHTELTFPAGTRGGGVEVQFPGAGGYPAGRMVRIDLTLKADGTTIATHREDFTPTGECEAIDAVFIPSDGLTGAGGAGGSAGAAGSGGAAGGGGGSAATGGTGAGGTSGAAGSAGTGGVAGTGGAAGRGGTGGVAGTGGVTGRGGTGDGVAGTGGAAGRGGTGGGAAGTSGAAGRGGTGGAPCVPTAEFCYNGADDDCDGRIDCEDSDCTPVAACVPLDAGGARIGVLVAANATCPPNYTDMTTLNQTLSATPCGGCSCRAPTVTSCSATISSFGTAAECASAGNAGTLETTLSSTQTCYTPDWVGSANGTVYGIQAGAFTPTLNGSCAPQGTATPGAPSWVTTSRFCAATMVGGGCVNGLTCAPVVTATSKCVMWEGLHTCQAGATTSYWNTGYTDTRTCGACTCGAATGQGCSAMRIQVGTDHTCSPQVTATLSTSQRYCYPNNGVYSPGLVFTGSPTQPTCPASATLSGALTATGQRTLCCM